MGVLTVTVTYPEIRTATRWRVKHDLELGNTVWRPRLPEVHPFFPNHYSEFGRGWQVLAKSANPKVSAEKMTVVYWYRLWMTNKQGFGMDGKMGSNGEMNPYDPRANYFEGKDLGFPNIRVEALTTGGSLIEGEEMGDNVVVNSLHYKNVPPLEWFMQHPEFHTIAVTVDGRGTPRPFPQGLQPDGSNATIIHPFVTNRDRYPTLVIPKYKLQRWEHSYPPDPFKLYL